MLPTTCKAALRRGLFFVNIFFVYILPSSINPPMTINATATIRCSHSVGTYWLSTPPNNTPSSVTVINAKLAPRNTETFDSVLAVIVITASWVLSPSSAKNKVKNAVPNIFQSITIVYRKLAKLQSFKNSATFLKTHTPACPIATSYLRLSRRHRSDHHDVLLESVRPPRQTHRSTDLEREKPCPLQRGSAMRVLE